MMIDDEYFINATTHETPVVRIDRLTEEPTGRRSTRARGGRSNQGPFIPIPAKPLEAVIGDVLSPRPRESSRRRGYPRDWSPPTTGICR